MFIRKNEELERKEEKKTSFFSFKKMESKKNKHWGYILGGILIFLTSVVTAVLLVQMSGTNSKSAGDFSSAVTFFQDHISIFLFNLIFVCAVGMMLFGVCGDLYFASFLLLVMTGIVYFANFQKASMRNEPIFPEELGMISELGTLLAIINGKSAGFFLAAAVLVLIIIVLLYIILRKYVFISRKISYILRAVFFIFGSIIFLNYLRLGDPDSWLTQEMERYDIHMDPYDQRFNYQENGMILGFFYNVQGIRVERPEGYSKAEIERIVEKYKRQARSINTKKKSQDPDADIIYILSESFTDPQNTAAEYPLSSDPIPYTHQILDSYSSGQALVPEYGGGTANTEFETLTGISNYFLSGTPYMKLVPKNTELPSIAKYLKSFGYKTTALHANATTMYRRDICYPNLGIDTYEGIDGLKHFERVGNGGFDSDLGFFNDVYDQLFSTDEKQFIHALTIQNHHPYTADLYNEKNYRIDTEDLSKEKKAMIESYLQGLSFSDQALADFFSKLNEFDRKVIVVFWGDHYPAGGLYNDLLDTKAFELQLTPYFIYANFDSPKEEYGIQSLQLLPADVIDGFNYKRTPYYSLLSDLVTEVPGLTKRFIVGKNGEYLNKEELLDIGCFEDYWMIVYDIVSGKKYSEKMGFFEVPE